MRTWFVAALVLAALGGCGGVSDALEPVSAEPPAGAEAAGKRAERQGGADPNAGEPIFKLRPREGERLRYTVTVRNTGEQAVTVTGVVADEDRDGAFVPERVAGAPVEIAARATAPLTIEGVVRGCRYGGQMVTLAGPELELGDSTEQVDLGIQVEMVVQGCT